jgi:Icc-related predicted phosphoesterase
MRVNVISDLHLEFKDLELPGGDILILSGDACESRTLRKYRYDPNNVLGESASGKRTDRAARFFAEECAKYRRVLYVMGNHEHYHGRYDRTAAEIREVLPANVTLLEQDSLVIDDVMFLGATLWTDLNKGNPMCVQVLKYGMNDYQAITNKDGEIYRKLDPRDTWATHRRTLEYFKLMCELNRDKKVVVLTHHAPSYASVHPHYAHDTDMNGGYASDLSEFILDQENILFWTHGHMHDPSDYMIGQCRVICNPRGYVGYEQQANIFDPTVGFDI